MRPLIPVGSGLVFESVFQRLDNKIGLFFFNSVAKSYLKTKAHEKRFKALL